MAQKKSSKKAPKAKAKPKATPKPRAPRKPAQSDLPGMEDRGIKELEDKANQLDDAQTQKLFFGIIKALIKRPAPNW